jgi:hypothetical protein
LDGHEVATLAIVEVLEALDLIGTRLGLPLTERGILDWGPDLAMDLMLDLYLVEIDGLEVRGSLGVLLNSWIEKDS